MTHDSAVSIGRRQVLATGSFSGLVALAGCLGDSGEEGSPDSGEDEPTDGSADPDETGEDEPTDGSADGRFLETGPTVGLETVAEGLASPTALVTAPGVDSLFIVDQPGVVYRQKGSELEAFLDVTDRVVDLRPGYDERGLLGMAFHPRFQADGTRSCYLRYSAPPDEDVPDSYSHRSMLSEFAVTDELRADPSSERVVLSYPNPQANHNAGPLAFGPDGLLYVATGDGGGADDVGPGHAPDWYDRNEGGNGQNTDEHLLGGILRLDVDGRDPGLGYAIPSDNPLVGTDSGREEYFAWGLRNPWGMSVDDATGELLVADVGQNLLESVEHVERGGNYGWNVREGTHCFATDTPSDPPGDCPAETPATVRGGERLRDPVVEYPHEYDGQQIGSSVVGGQLYRTDTLSALEDTYVFGDWSGPLAGRLLVAYPPDGWPEETTPERDLRDQTDGHDSTLFEEERWAGLWPIEELAVEAEDSLVHDENPNRLGRFVLGIERDSAGELYVLTNDAAGPTGDGGAVHRLVPPETL